MSSKHFISFCGPAGMLCARAERHRKNRRAAVTECQRTGRGLLNATSRICSEQALLCKEVNNAEADDASYLRYRLTFSGVCLKSPSNWSLAHWKKRQEKQIKRQTCLVKWGVFAVCKNALSDDRKAVFMNNVIPMLVPYFGVRLKYFKYLIIFHRHL